ncbi:7159_t:CDS:2 [Gigaspora margarita]|uniref:7159_t:CDS:1 n=1 Tax=Gigaspora margarita TaxID=4874 RepID=A0ABN7VER8_GIGMA|nr:7159_t:CDS:2 [Gigaspora margarita]
MNTAHFLETPRECQNYLAREVYACQKLHTEAESNEQADYRLECLQCGALYWLEEKVAGSALAPIFSTCCANEK